MKSVNYEEQIMLDTFLNYHLFNEGELDKTWSRYGLNLVVRPDCTQKCEYCYIYKHGDKLYPHNERVSNEVILSNLDKLLTYLIHEKQCYVRLWELFAGDMFFDGLYFDIVDIFYKHYSKLRMEHPELWTESSPNDIVEIITPLNISFLHKESNIARLETYLDKFKAIDCVLGFSLSTDGKYAEGIREKYEVDDIIYERMFTLMNKHGWGVHPMVSAESIEYAIPNHQWWREQFDKYIEDPGLWSPSYLEVRNPNVWTDDKINLFIKFLDYLIQERMQMCDNDISKLAKSVVSYRDDGVPIVPNNDLIALVVRDPYKDNFVSCGQDFLITLTLNNLSLYPCHRLAYRQFKGGQFVMDENNEYITGISAEGANVSTLFTVATRSPYLQPKCVSCSNNYFCIHGCLGAQYEYSGEMFCPIDSVCNLEKAKTKFLVTKYQELGVLDEIMKCGYLNQVQQDALKHYMLREGLL